MPGFFLFEKIFIMASGLGKRFGGDKLMEMLNGKPIIRWIIDATNNSFDKRIVVTRNTKVKAMCDLLKLPEGKGGNFVAKNNPQMVHSVNVKEEYELWDIDIVSDLEKIKNVLKTE